MPRAYSPRLSTVHLIADILARPGVGHVRTIAPSRRGDRRTRLRITSTSRDGWGKPIYSDFTLPEARAWLAADIAADDAAVYWGCPLCGVMITGDNVIARAAAHQESHRGPCGLCGEATGPTHRCLPIITPTREQETTE